MFNSSNNKETIFDILFDKHDSYHEFFIRIYDQKPKKIAEFLHKVVQSEEIRSTNSEKNENHQLATFSKLISLHYEDNILNEQLSENLFHFYRYIISFGAKYINRNEIEEFYKILRKINIENCFDKVKKNLVWIQFFPSYISNQSLNMEGQIYNEEWFEEIIKKATGEFSNTFCYSSKVYLYLAHHIIIMELIVNNKGIINMTNRVESLINRYIDLIENYPELEQIFGITIEQDLRLLKENIKFQL